MQHIRPYGIVEAWQDAANKQDIEQLLALSNPEIEIAGPRGSGRGHQLLRDWLARAGLTLETQRVFVRGHEVVVAQHAEWRHATTGEVTGEADLASRFRVEDGRVVLFGRYDTLDQALGAAGLNYVDEADLH